MTEKEKKEIFGNIEPNFNTNLAKRYNNNEFRLLQLFRRIY